MSDSKFFSSDPLDPAKLEQVFRHLRSNEEVEIFSEEIQARYAREPENPLLAAWHYRLAWSGETVKERAIAWAWAIPLALLNGLIFWGLSAERFMFKSPGESYGFLPWLITYWMPISAVFIIIYLAGAGRKRWREVLISIVGLALLMGYVYGAHRFMIPRPPMEQYVGLAAMHLPLLAWGIIGLYALAGRHNATHRFALMLKMLEIVVLAGIFILIGGLFVGITTGLFEALSVQLPDWAMRLLLAGGGGLIPVLVTATLYDPTQPPAGQSFEDGLSKIIAILMRLMLPLSILMLTVYLAFIPFNFRAPLTNRQVLIIYNAMLFGVMLLLLGVTPVEDKGIADTANRWLRRGIMFLTTLALIVGLYALFAILYRTWRGVLTPNRMAFIGWNVINISLLAYLLWKQWRVGEKAWVKAQQVVFARAGVLYLFWALVVALSVPWIFGRAMDPAFSGLPRYVQQAIYGEDYPILLKCDSPHIYALEHGEKRWIKDIPTFEKEGFLWKDVRFVRCEDLRRIPDGPPIPPDAGTPPAPVSPYGPAPTATPPPVATPGP